MESRDGSNTCATPRSPPRIHIGGQSASTGIAQLQQFVNRAASGGPGCYWQAASHTCGAAGGGRQQRWQVRQVLLRSTPLQKSSVRLTFVCLYPPAWLLSVGQNKKQMWNQIISDCTANGDIYIQLPNQSSHLSLSLDI